MKKFLRCVVEWKISACVAFTASVFIYMLIAFFLGERSVSLGTLCSLLLLACAGSFLQYLCFTDRIVHGLRYSLRLVLFAALFLPILAVIAWMFDWLPKTPGAWITMVLIFFGIFAVMTLGFEIYFRLAGKHYDGLLGEYKRTHGQDQAER